MANTAEIRDAVVAAIVKVTGRPAEEVAARPDARFAEDLGMTSVEFFPIISELEDSLGIEIDFAGYLNNATSVNATVEYLASTM